MKTKQNFSHGKIVATPTSLQVIEASGQSPSFFLDMHLAGNWGIVCAEDAELNNQALLDGSRLLSAYQTLKGERIWVITEAADENGSRIATTILLPEEY